MFVLRPLLSPVPLPPTRWGTDHSFSILHNSSLHAPLWPSGAAAKPHEKWIAVGSRAMRACPLRRPRPHRWAPGGALAPSTASPEARNPWADTREWSRSYASPNKLSITAMGEGCLSLPAETVQSGSPYRGRRGPSWASQRLEVYLGIYPGICTFVLRLEIFRLFCPKFGAGNLHLQALT